ncbi:MAG: sigma-54 dependent transcriptional regulator [Desulfobulbales bacterium]|nr:sigma-54 dependent transcriptional regulator [Desulfobulbales bacterium]
MHTILVVDDEPNYLIVLSELLKEEGYEIMTAQRGEEGLKVVEETDLDLVITDMRMPGMDGLDLLKAVKAYNKDLPVIMITAFGEVEKAVVAMKAGAYNYLAKPFNNEELLLNIRKAIEHYSLLRENLRLRDEARVRYGYASIVGKNARMQEIYQLIEKVAPTAASVLITGESGTGKELVARAIHINSPREKSAFISVNCAALPETLLESELFGHERGAFTGANAMRKGRFELADSGTLFLDEIGDIPMPLQAKLLRVLQERSFERVGGTKPINVDVRIITATNKELKGEVDEGRFREDLYYRLNVLHIHLPPLRERVDDIPMLTDHFISKFAKMLNKPNLKISGAALRYLVGLPWEGNVRELENTIERSAILCSGDVIQTEDVHPDVADAQKAANWSPDVDFEKLLPVNLPLPEVLSGVEEQMIKRALKEANFVQARAAESLGITKSLLQYKMKKYQLQKK